MNFQRVQVLPGEIAVENPGLCLTPFQRKYLLKSLETDLRAEYRRRIKIMLLFDAGQTQAQICEALGCSQETARYWIAIASSKQAHKWSNYSNHLGGCYNSAVLGRFALLSLNSSPNALFLKILCRTFRANTPYVSVQKLNSSPINKLI